MTFLERKRQVREYLGTWVRIGIDRPIGYVHHKAKYDLVYPINYGYVPGVLGGDGEELDVYLVGPKEPLEEFEGRIVGIVHRRNDVEDKLIMVSEGTDYTAESLYEAVHFQERHYDSYVEILP